MSRWALVHLAVAPNESQHQTQRHKAQRGAASAWQIVCIHVTDSDQTNRSEKYHGGLGIPKIERKCQQSWRKREISQTRSPDVRATNKRGSIMWSQEGPLLCMWKYQITITFTRLLEAWVALFEQKQHIMFWVYWCCLLVLWSVCRTNGLCSSKPERMKWHHLMFVHLCDSVEADSAQLWRVTMLRVKVNIHGEFHEIPPVSCRWIPHGHVSYLLIGFDDRLLILSS